MNELSGSVFAPVPAGVTGEYFEDLVTTAGARVERIVSSGQATLAGQWYDQDTDELVILIDGEAGLRFEDTGHTQRLAPGDWHWIPAHRRHRVEWTSAKPPAVWLAVHLTPGRG